jgi:hypothetical protein
LVVQDRCRIQPVDERGKGIHITRGKDESQ